MSRTTQQPAGMLLIGTLVLSAFPALAQVVTPPPAKAPTMEERHPVTVAPPQNPPPAPPPQSVPVETTPRVAAPNLAKAPPRVKKEQLPPGINFSALVQTDAAGAVKRLSEPTEIAALRVNPTLGSGFMERNAEYLRERHAAFEKVVIGNLDLLEKIEAGEIERIDSHAKTYLNQVVNFLKPLSGLSVPEGLSNAMQRAAIMDPTQAEVNRQIAEAYGVARLAELNTRLKDQGVENEPRAADLVKLLQRSTIDESEFAYRGLIAEAAGRLALAKDMDLSAEAKAAATTSAGSFRDSLDQDQKIKIYHDATALWTTAQRQEFLRRVIDARSSAK